MNKAIQFGETVAGYNIPVLNEREKPANMTYEEVAAEHYVGFNKCTY